jgi:hypothetical protein
MKTTLKQVKEKIHSDSYSLRNGVFTLRDTFFYRMGKDEDNIKLKVLSAFPNANILDNGEIYKAFRGGASIANSSHWFVKFTIPE